VPSTVFVSAEPILRGEVASGFDTIKVALVFCHVGRFVHDLVDRADLRRCLGVQPFLAELGFNALEPVVVSGDLDDHRCHGEEPVVTSLAEDDRAVRRGLAARDAAVFS